MPTAIAFGFSAVHALSPVHGKTLVGAYLVGSRSTPGAELWLGLTTTVTHTVTVFALGVATLVASWYVVILTTTIAQKPGDAGDHWHIRRPGALPVGPGAAAECDGRRPVFDHRTQSRFSISFTS